MTAAISAIQAGEDETGTSTPLANNMISVTTSATDSHDDGDGGVLSAIGHEFDPHSFTYTSRDVILYALGGKRLCAHTIMLITVDICTHSWCYTIS